MIDLEEGDEVVCSGLRPADGAYGISAATVLVTRFGHLYELSFDVKRMKWTVKKIEP